MLAAVKQQPPCGTGRLAVVALLLVVAVGALYLPTLRHGYALDDALFVSRNPVVQKGLGGEGLRWAFVSRTTGYWHPLTWLSHMADVQLFGLKPGPRHVQGIVLHAGSAVLLLLLLCGMTGAFWRPAFVAALFALHPLNVETVAWTAERKGVLAGFFWLLVLLAYARAAQRPGRAGRIAVVGFFALALMAKPNVVALPLVLLALDGWPLGRFAAPGARISPWQLLAGKVALFAMAAADSALTLFSARPALPSLEILPLDARLKNAAVSAVTYIAKAFLPSGLAVHYPLRPEGPPAQAWVPAVFALAAVTALAARERRRRPWLAAGWAWYIVTLLPVAGIVQLGFYARTDRYAYLPLIGVFVIVAWGGAELLARSRRGFALGAAAAAVSLFALAATTKLQVGYWKDERALYAHALEVTEENWLAHNNLGMALTRAGRGDEAIAQFAAAVRLRPEWGKPRINLGEALLRRGEAAEALRQFQTALLLLPEEPAVHDFLGQALMALGRPREAASRFAAALRLQPAYAGARERLRLAQAAAGGSPQGR